MPVMKLTRGADECVECVSLSRDEGGESEGKGEYCTRHKPELDARDLAVLDVFVDALIARRARMGRSGQGSESFTHSIHVVKRRMVGSVRA